jgi:predicted RND superfamily exporter protein
VISRPAIARPRATLVVVGVITALLGAAAAGVRTDNSLPVWLPGDDPELAVYERFRARFGEDSFVLAAATGVDLARAEDRAALAAVASDLRAAPGVGAVLAPVGADGAVGNDIVARRLAGPRMAGLLVTPREDVPQADRPAFVDAVAARLREAPLTFHLAGPEVINRDMDAGSQASFGTLFPVVVAVISGVLLWALRAPTVVAAIMLTAGVACVWTIGALALAGRSLNMVVVIVPALLVVLGTAYAIHVVTATGRAQGEGHGDDLLHAAEHAFAPCLLTALTTAAGLASLVSSGLAPVRDLGLFGALGVLVAFLLTFTALPAALTLLRWTAAATTLTTTTPGADRAARWTAGVARRAPLILAAGALLLAASVLGLRWLRVESHVLRFFAPDHPLRKDTAAIEDGLLGLTPIEAWLEGPEDAVLSADTIAAARAFTADCLVEADVLQVISPLDHDPRLASLPPAAAAKVLRRALTGGDLDLTDPALARYVQRDQGALAVRLTLLCRTTESERSLALSERVRDQLTARFARTGVEAHVTGAIPLLVRVQALLVRTQVTSFAGALAVVAAILLAAYRAPLLVLAALVPNVVPVLLTLGVMGWSGVPLDVATVTVASIALGLVVDDTIHMLHRYVEARGQGAPRQGAVASALRVVARPVLLTWLAMALGFAAFGAAPFRPTRDFGLLVAATSVSAVACDLLLLPALLLLGARTPSTTSFVELAREVTP